VPSNQTNLHVELSSERVGARRRRLPHIRGASGANRLSNCVKIPGILLAGVIVGLALHSAHLHWPLTFDDPTGSASQDKPFEFLYLDSARVEAYLAELDGGTFAQQHLSHKVIQTANGEFTVEPVKAGVSAEDENLLEREVTATAASRYVELLHQLGSEVHYVDVRHFKTNIRCNLSEGDFVSIETRYVRPPVYLNPFLAVKQAGTLSALFPMPSSDPEQRKLVEARREAALQFSRQVGEDPRAVFAIQPRVGGELGKVRYLLPMAVGQLSAERSLIKFGGGEFTVVGKVVRIFPRGPCDSARAGEPRQQRQIAYRTEGDRGKGADEAEHPAYVDSPTRETWEHALEGATPELICRTNPRCASAVRSGDLHGGARLRLIEAARREILRKLRAQTRIEKYGAVILPIATYT
jgi:hypothetical protein